MGNDVITDFGSGDRLNLGGQTYSVSSGGDGITSLALSGGGTIVLIGVSPDEFNDSYVA